MGQERELSATKDQVTINRLTEATVFTVRLKPWTGKYRKHRLNRFPFGISSVPYYFQRRMQMIFSGSEEVLCQMNDILVMGAT